MNKELSFLLEEFIKLENNTAALYSIFSNTFPEDANFWWELAIEEKHHASLLRSGKDKFASKGLFPTKLISSSLESLEVANKRLAALIEKYGVIPPSREAAFSIATKLEQSAGERDFQEFMDKTSESKIDKIFQKLNYDEKDHVTRLRSYMNSHDMNVQR